jgi:hypothetical protein
MTVETSEAKPPAYLMGRSEAEARRLMHNTDFTVPSPDACSRTPASRKA